MRLIPSRFGFLIGLCLFARPAVGQTRPLVRWPEALGFVALGGVVFAADGAIRSTIQGHRSGFRNTVADIGNGFGNPRYVLPALMVANAGANAGEWEDAAGITGRALKSVAIGTVATVVLKSLIGRRRPDISPNDPYRFNPVSFNFNSLPSGHTTVAFALATSLALEMKSDLAGAGLYALAATTSFGRMHADKHWASDTLAGAAVGILAARFVRRHDSASEAAPQSGTPLILLSLSF